MTGCDMVYDIDGFIGYSNESDLKRCLSLNGGDYSWYSLDEWLCNITEAGWRMSCSGRPYTCSSNYDWWAWRGSSGVFGPETWGKRYADSAGCKSGAGILNCPHVSNCEWSAPGHFNAVRSGAGGWGGCELEDAGTCECRCNRDKLECADHIGTSYDEQSCWVPSGDSRCS